MSDLPVVRLVPHEALRIAAGHQLVCVTTGGQPVLVRLYTADELLDVHADACARLDAAPSMTFEQAQRLVRPTSTDGDLHDLHPQPGEPPAAPIPPTVTGWAPGHHPEDPQ